MITVDKAVRTRWCHTCHREIPAGTHHLRYGSIGLNANYNLCRACLTKMEEQVESLNYSLPLPVVT